MRGIVTLFLIMALGCDKKNESDNCLYIKAVPVIKVEGPDHASLNQEVPLSVYFNFNNGCGKFLAFDNTIMNNNINVTVIGKYEGCACTESFVSASKGYTFKATVAGDYILAFSATDSTITHTIQVR